ncbi:MAG: SelB C-terminal domain-containing protein [Gemmatimonadetes bacterium]|nr:SelB C-terminal domain-containing protein [Gemmatimonadota bacterium]
MRFHLGTTDVGARLLAAGGRLEPGRVAPVRFVLDAPVVARAGDRFVLRAASPPLTIGGGVVTDPHPPGPRARPFGETGATLAQRTQWIVRECAGAGLAVRDATVRLGVLGADVDTLASKRNGVLRIADRFYDESLRESLRTKLSAAVSAFHAREPLAAGLTLESARAALGASAALFDDIVGELTTKGKLTVHANILARTGFTPASGEADARRLEELAAAVAAGALEPPSVAELTARFGLQAPTLLRLLEKQKRVVAVAADRYYAPGVVAGMVDTVRKSFRAGEEVTASQVREALGLSRKYVIPFLEYCDRVGLSDRRGDLRVFRTASDTSSR